jgi:SPRY domain
MGLQDVEYHEITWDATRVGSGLILVNNHHLVAKLDSDDLWQSVFETTGFSSGIHYWDIKVVQVEISMVIGVSKSLNSNATISYPGMESDKGGVGYSSRAGNRFYRGVGDTFGPTFTAGDVMGTLLNMNDRTATFYKNGVRIGTAIGKDKLTDDIYYPCIAHQSLEDKCVTRESFAAF